MLRLREILNIVKVGRAKGQRRHGHFDHDANCAIGPFPESYKPDSIADVVPGDAVHYTVEVDPVTGESIYRSKQL